jgi:nitrogen regulatory protein P-II 1
MKKIEAVIRPHKVEDVREALLEAGVKGMTILEVRGMGRQKGHTEFYRGSEYHLDFVPKAKVEVVLPDDMLDKAIDIILRTASTGEVGDGKIFVSTIDDAIRVRTKESGESAL